MTNHYRLPELDPTGYLVLANQREHAQAIGAHEWRDLEYVAWKSSGATRFAPVASATGALDCGGFWAEGRPDRGGTWTANAARCPALTDWVGRVGADYGRVRVIELPPASHAQAVGRLHLDDNNRLNRSGSGWIVRCFLNLTDDPDSYLLLRESRDDPGTEVRVPLPAGATVLVDTERLYHAVCHAGPEPRYALIASFESGPHLRAFAAAHAAGGSRPSAA